MESQEYLNQLSAKVRPEKVLKGGLSFLNSIYVKIILGAVVALVLLALLGSLISGTRVDESTKVLSLSARISNTESVIKTYQTNIKSSDLRSNTASLSSVLSNTSRDITTYAAERYKSKSKEEQKAIDAKAASDKEELETELFSAKINGILDRIFAHKMAYEISVIATREEELINTTKNEELKEILTTSYESLANLYDEFNDFSETN